MKRALVAGLLFAGFLSVASYAYAWEINADSKLGVATYREEYGIIESDWLAFYSGGIISLGHYPEEGFIGGADFGMGFTPNADEDWEITGRPFSISSVPGIASSTQRSQPSQATLQIPRTLSPVSGDEHCTRSF